MSFHKFIPILSLLFICTASQSEEPKGSITWEVCIREAQKNNPDLIAAASQVTQAEANKGKTAGDLLPRISGSLSTGRSGSSGEDASNSYSYGISASQLIFDGLKSWYDLDQSEQTLIATRLDYDLTSAKIRLNLRTAFINLLKSQELIGITEDIARRRKQQAALVELRYQAGREHRGALLTARANLAQSNFDITVAVRSLHLAQKQLSKELGRREFRLLRARGNLEITFPPPEKPDFTLLMEQHPLGLKAIAETESTHLDLKSARADFFPEINGTASISRSDSDWPPRDERWSLRLSLSLPLFEGFSRINEIYRAKAALREAEEDERSERYSILLELQEVWTDLQDARDNVAIQQQFLQADEERAKISEAQYATGILSFDNWIIIENNLVKTKKTCLQARANALKAEAEWVYARGGTLDFNPEN